MQRPSCCCHNFVTRHNTRFQHIRATVPHEKHHKSAKLPWRHNMKLSFCIVVFLSFCLLIYSSFYLFVFLSFCVLLSGHHSDHMSEVFQVSKATLCVQMLKGRWVTKGRYKAARATKKRKNCIPFPRTKEQRSRRRCIIVTDHSSLSSLLSSQPSDASPDLVSGAAPLLSATGVIFIRRGK